MPVFLADRLEALTQIFASLGAPEEDGLVGMLWVNAPTALSVVPWGGIARHLGTNPLAVAIPGRDGPALSLDMARASWLKARSGSIGTGKSRRPRAG